MITESNDKHSIVFRAFFSSLFSGLEYEMCSTSKFYSVKMNFCVRCYEKLPIYKEGIWRIHEWERLRRKTQSHQDM